MSNTSKSAEKPRNLGIDMLCCLGVMLLLGLQYISSTGFTEAPIYSYMSALPIAARWFCLSGAMLLAAGTGYVLSARKFSGRYFRILGRLIYTYILCGAGAIAIRKFLLREALSIRDMIEEFLSFAATENGRIIGMYFALLLAAPFLNAAFHELGHRKPRQAFLVITALISTLQPTLMFDGVYLIPAWCKGLFPIAAYIGGAYIRRYIKRRDILSLVIFMLSVCIAQTVVVLSVSLSKGVMYCPWLDSMASLPCLCIALCLLGIFHSRKEGTGTGHRFFGMAAGGALGALMIGDVLLVTLVPALEERFPALSIRLWAGFAVVPIVFILCCTLSLILQAPFLLVRRSRRGAYEEEFPEEFEDDSEEEESEEDFGEEYEEETPVEADAYAEDVYDEDVYDEQSYDTVPDTVLEDEFEDDTDEYEEDDADEYEKDDTDEYEEDDADEYEEDDADEYDEDDADEYEEDDADEYDEDDADEYDEDDADEYDEEDDADEYEEDDDYEYDEDDADEYEEDDADEYDEDDDYEYEEDDDYEYDEEEEYDDEEEIPTSQGYVKEASYSATRPISIPDPNAGPTNSRHTISVPVAHPQAQQVRLTQPPADDHPIGAQVARRPEPVRKSYSLDDILTEQGIPVAHNTSDVDDLIAEITRK